MSTSLSCLYRSCLLHLPAVSDRQAGSRHPPWECGLQWQSRVVCRIQADKGWDCSAYQQAFLPFSFISWTDMGKYWTIFLFIHHSNYYFQCILQFQKVCTNEQGISESDAQIPYKSLDMNFSVVLIKVNIIKMYIHCVAYIWNCILHNLSYQSILTCSSEQAFGTARGRPAVGREPAQECRKQLRAGATNACVEGWSLTTRGHFHEIRGYIRQPSSGAVNTLRRLSKWVREGYHMEFISYDPHFKVDSETSGTLISIFFFGLIVKLLKFCKF